MRIVFFLFFISFFFLSIAQDSSQPDDIYLEDQFYLGITYNFILNKPSDVTQRSLSYGLQGGFIKDLPINSTRTRAIGIGLGYAINSYYSNIRATESQGDILYSRVGNDSDFKRSKIENHLIELPIEYRWRNSTPEEYKFWRIYTGVRLGYVFSGRSKFISEGEKTSFSNNDLRKLQYGLTFNVGWNTFNIHIYYALSSLFNDSVALDNEMIEVKPLRVGFIFYIL
ncbi:porin family protein [Maribacter halichondriae]|uniref:porin family protein n=1 Tax=Maribacter halichondriae TaxID=2980554 RepID=UPI002358F4C1|nr:porin family protein [Maribacter sp. Hal144]